MGGTESLSDLEDVTFDGNSVGTDFVSNVGKKETRYDAHLDWQLTLGSHSDAVPS